MDNYPEIHEYVDEKIGFRAYLAIDREHRDRDAGMQWPVAGGGIRMRPGGSRAEAQDLAREMTLKFALISPRIGGAKMVIDFDPGRPEKSEVISRAVAHFAERYEWSLVTGADLNTTIVEVEEALAAIGVPCAQYALARSLGGDVDARVKNLNAGLHAEEGGLLANELSAGYSTYCATREVVARVESVDLTGFRIAIQGFGAVAGSAARFFERCGAKVVALADSQGTALYPDGAPISRLLPLRRDGLITPYVAGAGRDLAPSTIAHPDAVKAAEADVFVPAAASYLVSADDAGRIPAKYIVCGANNPFNGEAVAEKLADAGKTVVPDYVANSGTAAMYHALVTLTPPDTGAVFDAIDDHIRSVFDCAWPLVSDTTTPYEAFKGLLSSRLHGDQSLEVAV